jgi:hypothetical protein
MAKFNPNQVSFYEGAVRAEGVARKLKIDRSRILTSQDKRLDEIKRELRVTNVPDGFRKYQLPFVFDKAQFFISYAPADADVPSHSHDEGDAVRFILDGSISHDGVELKSGDWMYIPQGVAYQLKIGPRGATMGYCYQCCCAGRLDLGEWVVNPSPE